MNALYLVGLGALLFYGAYRSYGAFLAKTVFSVDPSRRTPAQEFEDGCDFVPSSKFVVFGHHFTSIAGTGPIVGPAIGVIWGWVPALIWIVFGSIFMGAVHDFGSLMMSLRHNGESIAQCATRLMGPRIKLYFYALICLALLIVIAIFGLIMAVLFDLFPQSVFPVWFEIPIAIVLGIYLKKGGGRLWVRTFLAVTLMYVTVYLGHYLPLQMPASLWGIPATGLWTIVLLIYALVASILPVTTLLQPRDYINAWQLYVALGLLLLGILVSGLSGNLVMSAPAFQLSPMGAPPIWPFLCITIACGAISGFHSLVASGTTAKQLSNEKDALMVGYGSMLVEGFLAVLVLVAVTAGLGMGLTLSDGSVLTGALAWESHYISWSASSGLGSKLHAVVTGFANILGVLGVPHHLGTVLIGVFIASFAGTTLDTSTRIQRYMIMELSRGTRLSWFDHPVRATFTAVISAAFLAFSSGLGGAGALLLWPLFGAVNQLLAALALLVLSVYLFKRSKSLVWVTFVPCVFILLISLWGTGYSVLDAFGSANWILVGCNLVIMVLCVGIFNEVYQTIRFKR